MNEDYRNIIFKGECIDSNDPKKLGRIRARMLSDNLTTRLESASVNGVLPEPWSERDPLVYLPLLPWFISVPPKGRSGNNEGEYVHLFYSNLDSFGRKDKYYISGVYSSPTTSNFEGYNSAVTNITEGSSNKNFQDILSKNGEINEKYRGVYAEPQDFALYGRGSADIIIQDDTVLLRAGKNKPFKTRSIPEKNANRSFIQLSNFETETTTNSEKEKLRVSPNNQPLKYLIEYDLINPSNSFNLFTGYIYIYSINDESITTKGINVNTNISESSKDAEVVIKFTNLSISETGNLITDTINKFISGNITPITTNTTPNIEIVFAYKEKFDNRFPLYYRPRLSLFNQLYSNNSQYVTKNNIKNLFDNINVIADDEGYNTIFNNQKKTDPSLEYERFKETKTTVNLSPKSVSIVGGDDIYFISHKTQKFDGERIDLSENIYKIDESKIANDINKKTSSLVRGEELIELLDLIIMYLVGHVHPWHQLPPDSTSTNEITVEKLMTELRNARDKLLNSRIRIN
jgi:hypothetical protein